MTLSDERVNEILCTLLKPKLYLPGGFLYIEPESIPDAARAVAEEAVAVERERPPMQPLVLDLDGVLRFKANVIVRFLLDAGSFDMDKLALMNFKDEDREQFAQLIGYSLSGFGELSYVSDGAYKRAERAAGDVLARGEGNDAER